MDFHWAQIVTWLIVIAGWVFVNQQNNLREKRKEIRSLIDNLHVQLDDIEKKAVKYHTDEGTKELAFQLKRDLNQKLRSKLKILELRDLDLKKSSTYQKELRKAITLNNFDTNNFKSQLFSSEIIKDIWLAKDKLSHEIELCFSRKYK
ncbi:MAG: hypothetical protein GQ582_09355 [Methyloprofundus sp.]|nr:hypothetical protein [Methyloprofundus sp.]